MEELRNNQNMLIETLRHTVDAENMLHFCCSRLASLIKNGRVRKRFFSLSQTAKENKEFLTAKLKSLGTANFLPVDKCRFCEVKSESFSLLGAVNLSLEAINVQIKLYKGLLKLTEDREDRMWLKKILEAKNTQMLFLRKEKQFASKDETKLNFMDSYCVPEIISQLWKQ